MHLCVLRDCADFVWPISMLENISVQVYRWRNHVQLSLTPKVYCLSNNISDWLITWHLYFGNQSESIV